MTKRWHDHKDQDVLSTNTKQKRFPPLGNWKVESKVKRLCLDLLCQKQPSSPPWQTTTNSVEIDQGFSAFVALLASCAPLVSAGIAPVGGHSNSFRKQDDHGNYAFGYDIKNGYGAVNGRKESGGHGGVVGSYYIGDIDGRHRSVHYVADKLGFRAEVKTNEPGTKTSYAAAAAYDSANGKTAPAVGLHVAPHIVAPVIAKAPVSYGPIDYGDYGGHGAVPFYG
ncbi:adult-specific rigid cuticular protein 15.7-like [Tropilaelaps mercedesae]|uniref:Adult-specific rigid cuticular protein 15.7-like n=1 Tax=Tropilaelaps mercedesae TaxID=418985 RepID=A0A1V9X390_9ACAR|nr:adult-specific rigid cuticular protein 15.7-like [Tropilaelaps mercedesae]